MPETYGIEHDTGYSCVILFFVVRFDQGRLSLTVPSVVLWSCYVSIRAARSEDDEMGAPNTERRFAYTLLEKLLEYVDKAAHSMVVIQSSKHFTKTDSFNDQNEEIKFFGKVSFQFRETVECLNDMKLSVYNRVYSLNGDRRQVPCQQL